MLTTTLIATVRISATVQMMYSVTLAGAIFGIRYFSARHIIRVNLIPALRHCLMWMRSA